MRISHRIENSVYIVCCKGSLMGKKSKEIEPNFHKVSEAEGIKGLVINLEQVLHIDSSGLAMLAHAYKLAMSQGLSFGLCGVNSKIQSILKLAKIDRIFTVYDTEEDAIAKTAG